MSVQNKTTLKSYFETGDKPTQSQFANLIDSMALVTDITGASSSNEPISIDASITVNDNGKLAMLDYDGNIKLYQETPATQGVKGKWKLKFNQISTEETQFQYKETNGAGIMANASNWNSGITTTEEEATAFASYLNSSQSNVFTVTSSSNADEVIIEQKSELMIEQEPMFSSGSVQISIIQNPQPATPKTPKRICVGIITNVNETNHTAVFQDIITLPVITMPDVETILGEMQNKNLLEHAMELAKLIAVPANGGKVRAITEAEMQNPAFALNSLQNALYFFIKPHTESGKFYCLKRGLG